jgi:hypothetical protein
MWSWFQIGIFLFLITVIFIMVAFTFAQRYMVTQIDNKLMGDDRLEPDIVVEQEELNVDTNSSLSSLREVEAQEDPEDELNMGYLSDS